MDISTAWKKPHFILSDESDFYMIDYHSITVYAFSKHMLTSFSVDEMPRYMKLSTNFRSLQLKVKMAPSCLKQLKSVLFAFT